MPAYNTEALFHSSFIELLAVVFAFYSRISFTQHITSSADYHFIAAMLPGLMRFYISASRHATPHRRPAAVGHHQPTRQRTSMKSTTCTRRFHSHMSPHADIDDTRQRHFAHCYILKSMI
jgi:hypothetical protein